MLGSRSWKWKYVGWLCWFASGALMLPLLGWFPLWFTPIPLGQPGPLPLLREPLAANLFISWFAQNEVPLKPCVWVMHLVLEKKWNSASDFEKWIKTFLIGESQLIWDLWALIFKHLDYPIDLRRFSCVGGEDGGDVCFNRWLTIIYII